MVSKRGRRLFVTPERRHEPSALPLALGPVGTCTAVTSVSVPVLDTQTTPSGCASPLTIPQVNSSVIRTRLRPPRRRRQAMVIQIMSGLVGSASPFLNLSKCCLLIPVTSATTFGTRVDCCLA